MHRVDPENGICSRYSRTPLTNQRGEAAQFFVQWMIPSSRALNCGMTLSLGADNPLLIDPVGQSFPCADSYEITQIPLKIPNEAGCRTSADACVLKFYGVSDTTDQTHTECYPLFLVDIPVSQNTQIIGGRWF